MKIKTGTDIVYIPRLQKIITDTPAFILKTYTASEIKEASLRGQNKYVYYAARFAAKEAIIKVFSDCDLEFYDIEICQTPSGKPFAKIHGQPVVGLDISLSSDTDYAIANAVLLCTES